MNTLKKIMIGSCALLVISPLFAANARWSGQCGPKAFNNIVAPAGQTTTGTLKNLTDDVQVITFAIPIPLNCTEKDVCSIPSVSINSGDIKDVFAWAANNNAYTTAHGPHPYTTPIYAYTKDSAIELPSQCIIVQVNGKEYEGKTVSVDVSEISNTGKAKQDINGNWG